MDLSSEQVVFVTDGVGRLIFDTAKLGLEWEERTYPGTGRYGALAQGQFIGTAEGYFIPGLCLVAAVNRQLRLDFSHFDAESAVLGQYNAPLLHL